MKAPRHLVFFVQESYRWYRKGRLLVNRDYQRKLVWTVAEKQKLIDSILSDFPLPLILLVETEDSRYEIIDGMQRLNAVFSFIETSYSLKTDKEEYFDLREFAFARQEGERGSFKPYKSPQLLLSGEKCANLLGYQLAVTIFSGDN